MDVLLLPLPADGMARQAVLTLHPLHPRARRLGTAFVSAWLDNVTTMLLVRGWCGGARRAACACAQPSPRSLLPAPRCCAS